MSIQPGLERITHLLTLFPPLTLPVIHLAGTNGKGSVSTLIDSVLSSSSAPPLPFSPPSSSLAASLESTSGEPAFLTGRFNSPHLLEEHDCIRICGRVVDKGVYQTTREEVEMRNGEESVGASLFEVLTMTALLIFERHREPAQGEGTGQGGEAEGHGRKLDLVILECGMGGLADATNVFPPSLTLLSILTSVDLDHQAFLGDTVELIARAKAGILKRGGVLIVGEQGEHEEVVRKVIQEVTTEKGGDAVWCLAGKEEKAVHIDGDKAREGGFSLVPFRAPKARTIVTPVPSSAPSPSPFALNDTTTTVFTTSLPLPGAHQIRNLSVALTALSTLRSHPHPLSVLPSLSTRITDHAIREGIAKARWAGRCDWVVYGKGGKNSYPLLLDGAHNSASAALLKEYIDSLPLPSSSASPPPSSSSSFHPSASTQPTASARNPFTTLPAEPSSTSSAFVDVLDNDDPTYQPTFQDALHQIATTVKQKLSLTTTTTTTTTVDPHSPSPSVSTSSSPRRPTTYLIAHSHSPPKTALQTLSPLLSKGDRIAPVLFTTPIAGMPWVQPVPLDVLRQTARELVGPEGEIWDDQEGTESGDGGGGGGEEEGRVERALAWCVERARADEEGLVVVCGSLYLVGEVYKLLGLEA
jgi:folylpolyglutamate synthase/dihydropteroate synthase